MTFLAQMATLLTDGAVSVIVGGALNLLGHGLNAFSGFLTGISKSFDSGTASGNAEREARANMVTTGAIWESGGLVTTEAEVDDGKTDSTTMDIVPVENVNRNPPAPELAPLSTPHRKPTRAHRKRPAVQSPISESPSCSYELEAGMSHALGIVQVVQPGKRKSSWDTAASVSGSVSDADGGGGGKARRKKRRKTGQDETATEQTLSVSEERADELKQLIKELVETFPKWSKNKIAKEGARRRGSVQKTLIRCFDELIEDEEVQWLGKGIGFGVV